MVYEPVIQNEVSQKQKNKYLILTYMYTESTKNGTDEPIYKPGVETQTQKTCRRSGGRRGWDELREQH